MAIIRNYQHKNKTMIFFNISRVEIEHTQGESVNAYLSATSTTPKKSVPEPVAEVPEETHQRAASDSDSSD